MLEIGAFHPAWGDIHLGPDNALKAHAMLGGVFMPVHWGTFALAMHAWDQPAERLLELAPHSAAQLLMPLLGQPVEPAHAEIVPSRVGVQVLRNSKERGSSSTLC